MNRTGWKCAPWGALLLACGAALGCGGRTTLEDPDPASEVPDGCWTASDELLILSPEELSVLNVRTRRVRSMGDVPCADEPFNSMAVSQRGSVYVGLESGRLIELDPSLKCRILPNVWTQGIPSVGTQEIDPDYGLTFLGAAGSESIVIADGSEERTVRLLTLDVQTAAVVQEAKVDLVDVAGPLELAGSPTDELYGFSVGDYRYPQLLLELDVRSGAVLDRLELGPGRGLATFAAGRLHDDIYTFTAVPSKPGAIVLKTDLITRRTSEHAKLPFAVLGAGVPGCVPPPEGFD